MKIKQNKVRSLIKKSLLNEMLNPLYMLFGSLLTGCAGSECNLTKIIPEAEGVPDPPDCVVTKSVDLNMLEIFQPYFNEATPGGEKSITVEEFQSKVESAGLLLTVKSNDINFSHTLSNGEQIEKEFDAAIIRVKNIPKGLISSFLKSIEGISEGEAELPNNENSSIYNKEDYELVGFEIKYPIVVIGDGKKYVCANLYHLDSMFFRFLRTDILNDLGSSALNRLTIDWQDYTQHDMFSFGDVYYPPGGMTDRDCVEKYQNWLKEYVTSVDKDKLTQGAKKYGNL